jgi:HEAT repeat protein
MRVRRAAIALIVLGWAAALGAVASAQPPRASESPAAEKVSPAQVRSAIDLLGSLDFPVRMNAGRTVRRAETTVAVPALLEAVATHKDSYVRFKALVVLSGFNDPRTGDVMVKALDDRNDRLRAAAYGWFEHHPDPKMAPRLLTALSKEESEFVRPSLTRALAALGTDAKVREVMTGLVMSGQDLFRAVVI